MKKVLATCIFFLTLTAGASAQSIEATLLDNDTSLTVRCSYNRISGYVSPSCHHEPPRGMARKWSSVTGQHYDHDCSSDNIQAQRIFLARLEKLNSPDIYRQPLSREAEKIVHNFELLTGIRNNGDGDLIGWCYISHLTRNGWKLWFNEHKDKLRYCNVYHILYAESDLHPNNQK